MTLQDYFSVTGISQTALAREIGVSAVLINQWKSGARQVPAGRCPDIERATNGAVTCEELRPDVNWGYLRGTAPRRMESIARKIDELETELEAHNL